MTNGTLVLDMTDNNSTLDTQDDASKKCPSTPSESGQEKAETPSAPLLTPDRKTTQRTHLGREKIPAWKEIPLGMIGTKQGKLKRRIGHPTNGELLAGRPVHKMYDLIFVKDGQRTNRLYTVTFTNMVNPDKTFRVKVSASSMKHLFRGIAAEIGNLRSTNVTRHFSLTCRMVTEQEGMTEETVHVPLADPVEPDHRPSYNPAEDQPIRLEE